VITVRKKRLLQSQGKRGKPQKGFEKIAGGGGGGGSENDEGPWTRKTSELKV